MKDLFADLWFEIKSDALDVWENLCELFAKDEP